MNAHPSPAILTEETWAAIGRSLRLSARELQIVMLLIEYRVGTEDTVARALGMSQHTVHTHLERLYKKIGVGSRSQLIVRVFAEYVLLRSDTAQPA